MTHLDEGTIHAWLDGALGADDAAAVERHVGRCDECAARVAEARGLIAGASRILSALDDVGSEIVLARAPGVRRTRVGPKVVRVVGWLAAAGLLAAVGLEARAKMGPELTPSHAVFVGPSPVPVAVPVPVPVAVSPAVRQSDRPAVGGSESRKVAQKPTPAPVEAAKVAAAPEEVAARSAANALRMQDVVVTGVADAEARTPSASAVEFGRMPMCFADLPATATAAASPLARNVWMLDTTPVSPNATDAEAPRRLLNAEGVAGEWQRLGTKAANGNDSLVLRFGVGAPPVRVMRAELGKGGLMVEGRVMGRVECSKVDR